MSDQSFRPPWERRSPLPKAEPLVSNVTGKTKGGQTPYQLGRAFEGAIRGRLQRRGYFVQRQAMSKGAVDLLAVGPPTVAVAISGLFIQCKRRGDISIKEWNDLYNLAVAHAGWPILTMRESERTVGFYRLDGERTRTPGHRPWTMIDPRDCSELRPPPTLLDKAA